MKDYACDKRKGRAKKEFFLVFILVAGSLVSSIGFAQSCAPAASGLVGWWPGDGSTIDLVGGNNGTVHGAVTYVNGEVSQAFNFSGSGSGVLVSNSAALQLQTLTIDAWVRRSNLTQASLSGGGGHVFGYDSGGYGFGVNDNGQLFLTQEDVGEVISSAAITDTNWHHMAVTRTGSTVIFYLDGVATLAAAYNPTFTFTSSPAIGAAGGGFGNSFLGSIDEVDIFNRALAPSEIQAIFNAGSAGKCSSIIPPAITTQPMSQTVAQNGSASFSVVATGTALVYQWHFNGTNLAGATSSALNLVNLQMANMGIYSVTVTNGIGSVTSSNASLTVNVAPSISGQPASQASTVGNNATFAVTASGSAPLTFQWQFKGSNISGATNSSLTVVNVQSASAGSYSVTVTNAFGLIASSNALLTVNLATCTSPPASLVSWWPAESSALDISGTNNGTIHGSVTYAPGKVGQAFNFSGSGDGVTVGNPANLHLQTFTIDAWISRSSVTRASLAAGGGLVFSYGSGGYGFGVNDNGQLFLSQIGASEVLASVSITDTNWHHMAVTKSGGVVVFYLDGVANPAATYNPTFTFSTQAAIGSRGEVTSSFLGLIDELDVFNRALGASEVQAIYNASSAGKCVSTPPVIATQPAGQTVNVGGNANFTVVASGGGTLSYQWQFNGSNISNATGSALSLVNVQLANAGNYSVTVTNIAGLVTSSNALLTVNSTSCPPPPSGLVSWWQGNGNAVDLVSTNNGTAHGSVTFVNGEVGQAFSFNGNGAGELVANSANLQLQTFTIDAWIQRGSLTQASLSPGGGAIFGYNTGGYILSLKDAGQLLLSQVDASEVDSTLSITDTNWHHVAVTKTGSNVVFYVDGVANPAPAYGASFFFGSSPAIGAVGDSFRNSFIGAIDEVDVFNRVLAASEIQAIFNEGSSGKCLSSPPVIVTQPASETVTIGNNASFSVGVSGLGILGYQWQFNGTNLNGATNSVLTIGDVQAVSAGVYSVTVSNAFSFAASSNALLTLVPAACTPPPSGLVSWWPAEGNPGDLVGANNGTVHGAVTYAAGQVGQAFHFAGTGNGISVGNSTNLQLQTFSIDAWVQRSSVTQASFSSGGGLIFSYGSGGYGFGVDDNGQLFLSQIGDSEVLAGVSITDTNWHHAAVTKTGSNVVFYVDGVADPAPAYNPTFVFSSSAAIGARGDGFGGSFLGSVDEVDVFNRALIASEVQAIYNAGTAGKCAVPPVIVSQPTNQTVILGGTATFSVSAAGAPPLSYQWKFGSFAINGATNSTLTLNNVQFTEAGSFKVVVANLGGSVTSTPATLTVNPVPSAVKVVSVTANSGIITVPINLVAQGNENALAFSLNFNPALLTFTGVTVGNGALGASLAANTNQIGSGQLGLALALSPGTAFTAGTHEIVDITFLAVAKTNANVAAIAFGDQPIVRQVSNPQIVLLSATYTNGTVTIPVLGFEGDVSPLPGGDGSVSLLDWVQEGRFVAGLDIITNAAEFQRADCAPRSTLGDGALTVADWVQVGRYAFGLDPLADAGGPTSSASQSKLSGGTASPADLSTRTITLVNTNGTPGQSCQVSIRLNAQGNENALGYSVNFDPTVLTFTSASLGGDASGATMNVNTNQAASGTVGLALALSTSSTFTAATHEIIRLQFAIASTAKGSTAITFSSGPVVQAVADAAANTLSAAYVPGTLAVTLPSTPNLTIVPAHGGVVLSWPASALGFNLESNPGLGLSNWTGVATVPVTNSATSNITVTLPSSEIQQYYRLHHP